MNNGAEYTDPALSASTVPSEDLEFLKEKSDDELKAEALKANIKPIVGFVVGGAFTLLSALVMINELYKKCCSKKKDEIEVGGGYLFELENPMAGIEKKLTGDELDPSNEEESEIDSQEERNNAARQEQERRAAEAKGTRGKSKS